MKPTSEISVTNFAYLRQVAIEKLQQEPHRVITMGEYQKVIETVRSLGLDYQDENVIEMLAHLQHDMTVPTALPKWAAIASWCNPHGLLSRNPQLIQAISTALL